MIAVVAYSCDGTEAVRRSRPEAERLVEPPPQATEPDRIVKTKVDAASETGRCRVFVELPDKTPADRATLTIWQEGARMRETVRADEHGFVLLDRKPGEWRLGIEYGEVFDAVPKPRDPGKSLWFARYLGSETTTIRAGETGQMVFRLRERDHSFIRLLCTDEEGHPLDRVATERKRRANVAMEPMRVAGGGPNGYQFIMVPAVPGTRIALLLWAIEEPGRFARGQFTTTGRGQGERVQVVLPTPIERLVVVQDADGRGIPQVKVHVRLTQVRDGISTPLAGGYATNTDAQGRAVLQVQPGQTYRILGSKRRFYRTQNWAWSAPKERIVSYFTLKRGLLLRGRVTDEQGEPTRDGRIVVRGPVNDELPLREGGAFEVSGLPAGDYDVQFFDGHQRLREEVRCELSHDLDIGVLAAHALERFEGVVVDGHGRPISKAEVFTRPGNQRIVADAKGRFQLEAARIEPVWFIIRRSGYATRWIRADLMRPRLTLRPPSSLRILSDGDEPARAMVRFGPQGAPKLDEWISIPIGKIDDLPAGRLEIEGPWAGPKEVELPLAGTVDVAVGRPR